MRYVIALGIAVVALLILNPIVGLSELPRPWGSLGLGAITGVIMVIVLLAWEKIKPSEDPEDRDARLRAEDDSKRAAPPKPGQDDSDDSSLEAEPPVDTSSEASRGEVEDDPDDPEK